MQLVYYNVKFPSLASAKDSNHPGDECIAVLPIRVIAAAVVPSASEMLGCLEYARDRDRDRF